MRGSWEDDQSRDLHCRSQESPWPEQLEPGPFRANAFLGPGRGRGHNLQDVVPIKRMKPLDRR